MESSNLKTPKGTLVVVGLGISLGQLTRDCESAIRTSDIVYCLTNNPASECLVRQLNPNVQTLQHLYAIGKSRLETYEEMTALVLDSVYSGLNVCFASYGHAGVFAYPTHKAIERARNNGHRAIMLPGVSAEDCMFADLGIDPAVHGCQSFDATDFLLRDRVWDPHSTLVLWQVPITGIKSLLEDGEVSPGFEFLHRTLLDAYGPEHLVTLYEATPFPLCDARIEDVALKDLAPGLFRHHTTLVIRPIQGAQKRNEEFASVIR